MLRLVPVLTRVLKWAVVCWVAVFWRLSYMPLIDPDEAHYAQITREMRQLGDYLVPRIDGVPIIDKPALFHWFQAGSFALFGENEFAARFPTAIACLALLWVTYWFGQKLFGRDTGERAALMLALTPLTFVLANVAIFDMIFNAFLFGAFSLLVISALERRPWLQVPGFLLLSLAVQIKGPFVLIVVVAVAMLASFTKNGREAMRRLHWVSGLTAAVIVALPWFVLMWRRFGQEFINGYVLYNNLQLFAAPLYRRGFYPFFYVRVAMSALFPWMLVALGGLLDRWRQRGANSGTELLDARHVMLWAWILVVFGFFSASRFKLDHYIFPIAPAVCLLAADAWQRAIAPSSARSPFTVGSLLFAGVAFVAIGGAGTFAYYTADLRVPPTAVGVCVAIAAGGFGWLLLMARGRWRVPATATVLMATMLVVFGGVRLVGLQVFDETRPGSNLGKWLNPHVQPDDHIVIYKQGRWKASFRFYVEHPVLQTDFENELMAMWTGPGRTYAVMIESDLAVLEKAGLPVIRVHAEPATIGNRGRYIREQIWGEVVIVTNRPQ